MSADLQEHLFQAALDEQEAKGEIWIKRGNYGFDIYVKGAALDEGGNETPVAWIDLFPESPEANGITKYEGVVAKLRVCDPNDEDHYVGVYNLRADDTEEVGDG